MTPASSLEAASPLRPPVAVFYLTHLWSQSIAHRFDRLRRELGADADCFVLLQDDHGGVTAQWKAFLDGRGTPQALVPFDPDDLLQRLGYRWFDRSIMGSTHFPLLHLSKTHEYGHYWQIESDVEYRGDWRSLLGAYRNCEADLLASHFRRHADWPRWPWWRTLRVPVAAALTANDLRRAFFPILRISRQALEALDQAHRDGWEGHFEALIPTVVHRLGLLAQDLCATTACYLGDSQDRCADQARQSTMRWRPQIALGEFIGRGVGPLLFHPVKENWAYDGNRILRWPEPAS
ncbi:DUF3405 domain-containing protein [Ramlibacter sp. WS9]|uniref:DUF3405 domain-containing protein n=1 Tax=Ramlibacter sp. WS9 TaxID=1882741 RepID=UPI0011421A7A|nr:DUF3405 domain-containing protein [Ramlibacter sp. WS9]ROZ75703.1 hypothetical protein EEB15_14130 [Ramlibacter sp. WS9]